MRDRVPSGLDVVGRGQVLGVFREVAEFSQAFLREGEARVLLPAQPPEDRLARAGQVLATLIGVIWRRLDLDVWVWGYGDGPDDLATLSSVHRWIPGFPAALADRSEAEIIPILAALARRSPSAPTPPFLPPGLKSTWSQSSPQGPVFLGLRSHAEGSAARLGAFCVHGGPDLPIWLADGSLGLRFRFDQQGLTFRAHHPVVQEALVERCQREGIDVGP